MIIAIWAQSRDGFIGKNNKLPFRQGSDMKNFKDMTLNHVVVMGRKTWESIGQKPLKSRVNYIVSTTLDNNIPGVTVVPSLEYFMEHFQPLYVSLDKDIFIIGGKQLYDEAFKLQIVDYCIVSYINKKVEGDIEAPTIPKIFFTGMYQYFERDDTIDDADMTMVYYHTINDIEAPEGYLYH
jgi:dihydrofolate reductase